MREQFRRVFRAFTDENRLQILELLCQREQCACVLLEHLQISQPTLSHHMKILCASGIVKKRRIGAWNYYSIDAVGCREAGRLLDLVAKGKLPAALKFARAVLRLLRPSRRASAAAEGALTNSCCCG